MHKLIKSLVHSRLLSKYICFQYVICYGNFSEYNKVFNLSTIVVKKVMKKVKVFRV